jgi:DNA-binding NarL/FixJ family response regulator
LSPGAPVPTVAFVDLPRVVLAEDHAGVAEQLRNLLATEFDVVATVADGLALVRAVNALQPDVVVADIVMPGLDGIAATAAILASRPTTRVVLATVHNDPELAERGYATGALACVSKHRAGRELLPAVRAALRGERYVGSGIGSDVGGVT